MAYSKARYLAELLSDDGRVKDEYSALDFSGGVLSLTEIPTITNAKLENDSITINSNSTALGSSVDLTTTDISEGTNEYFTNARAISAANTINLSGSIVGTLQDTKVQYGTSYAGTPVQGSFFFDSLNQRLKVYTGSDFIDAIPDPGAGGGGEATDANTTFRKYIYSITSETNAVTGADDNTETLSYVTNGTENVEVFVNGVKVIQGTDYIATTGTSVAFTYNIPAGSTVEVQVYELLTNDAYYTKSEVYTKTETNSQISTAVAGIVDTAPTTLDTLNELAAALGDDPNFATTTATTIGSKIAYTTDPGTAGESAYLLSIGKHADGYQFIQSHGSQVLKLNPLGNAIEVGGELRAYGGSRANRFYNSISGSNASNAKNHFTQFNGGTDDIATGWIASAFGDATNNRVVIGQVGDIGSGAVIGSHSGNLDSWASLEILAYPTISFRAGTSGYPQAAEITSTGIDSKSNFKVNGTIVINENRQFLGRSVDGVGSESHFANTNYVDPDPGIPRDAKFGDRGIAVAESCRMQGNASTFYGPNSTWGAYLVVGGDGRGGWINDNNVASVVTTDGNLHLDPASGHGTYINFYDGNIVYFGSGNNSNVASIDPGGNAVFAGNVTPNGSVSDIRLKENVTTIENAVEKVSAIRGVTFNYIDSEEAHAGVIAQDVIQVLPEVVYETGSVGNEDEKHYSVRYGNMVGLLIEAIKEQQETINTLTQRIDALENK